MSVLDGLALIKMHCNATVTDVLPYCGDSIEKSLLTETEIYKGPQVLSPLKK